MHIEIAHWKRTLKKQAMQRYMQHGVQRGVIALDHLLHAHINCTSKRHV
jgi:hypothetical protein